MQVLFITANRRFLEEDSEERQLLHLMSEVVGMLHVVVLTRRHHKYSVQQMDAHTWLYPTNTLSLFPYFFSIFSTVRQQVSVREGLFADVVLSDDPHTTGWAGWRLADIYHRPWLVNLHNFPWERGSVFQRWWHFFTLVPLSALLQGAAHICVFSERVHQLVAQVATEEQRTKIFPFPKIYTDPTRVHAPVDVRTKYPEFNFIVVVCIPEKGENIDLILATMSQLRSVYPRAGVVVLTLEQSFKRFRKPVQLYRAESWVRFETTELGLFPFTQVQAYLYLASGEDEDVQLLHAMAAACPIVAVGSTLSQKVVHDGVNGILARDRDPGALATAIRRLNETPGLREQFKVNASLLLSTHVIPTREDLRQKLEAFFDVAPIEEPLSMSVPEAQLLARLTHVPTRMEKIKNRLGKVRDKYTKLR